jgi:putative aldouronate transport system substrate-binding protein
MQYGDFVVDPKDNTIKNLLSMPVKSEMQRQHRWYKAGYFQKDLEDMITKDSFRARLKTEEWVFTGGAVGPNEEAARSNEMGVPVVTSGAHVQPLITRNMVIGALMAIPVGSKHPVEAIKMLLLMNKDQYVNNLINFGIEGKHWNFVDKAKGIIKFVPDSGYRPDIPWALPNTFLNYITVDQPPDIRSGKAFSRPPRRGSIGFGQS